MTIDELEAFATATHADVSGDLHTWLDEVRPHMPALIAVYRAAERHARHGPVTPTAAEARCAASSETRAELLAALAALR